MALDVGDALRDGIDRGTERNALLLMVVVGAVSLASTAFSQTALVYVFDLLAELAREQGTEPPSPDALGPTPLVLPIPGPVAGLLFVAAAVLNQAIGLVAIRTFVSDVRTTVPREFVTRRIGWVTLNAVVGGLVVGALIVIGLVLLIVPGIFVAVSLFFFEQEVAVEDSNLVEAIEDSWALSKGERVEIFLVAAVLAVAALSTAVPTAVLRPVLGGLPTAVLGVAISAVVTVVSIAVASRAYTQVKESEDAGEEPEDDGGTDEGEIGALGPDEVDDAF